MTLSAESRKQFRKILEDMRSELVEEVRAQIKRSRERDYVGDLADCATSDMITDYAHMFGERLQQRLQMIDDALEAIEDGYYGLCEECDEPINEKRLELMPFARFCVRCQSELERQAKMRGETFTDISLMDSRYRPQAGSE